MKEDPIREAFPQLLSKAFSLGCKQYIPGEGDLGQAMMGALMEVMHWLHKEHRIYLVVAPVSLYDGVRYSFSVIHAGPDQLPDLLDVESEKDDEYYADWPEAYVEGLEVCLNYLEQLKKQTK